MYIRVVDVRITLTTGIFEFLLSDLHCDPVCFLRFSHVTLPPLRVTGCNPKSAIYSLKKRLAAIEKIYLKQINT